MVTSEEEEQAEGPGEWRRQREGRRRQKRERRGRRDRRNEREGNRAEAQGEGVTEYVCVTDKNS